MSARSGVFIKYVVAFVDADLTISNDLLTGDVCLDADVSVRMSRGTAGADFEIKLFDLPEKNVKVLVEKGKSGKTPDAPKPHLTIKLGYFDTKVISVLDGIYESVESKVEGDKLVTTIKGREAAFYACATTPYTATLTGEKSYKEAVGDVLKQSKFPPNCVAVEPQVNDLPKDQIRNLSFTSKKVLGVVNEIAERAKSELLIIDGKVFVGAPIRYDDVGVAELDREVNLAEFQPFKRDIPSDYDLNFPEPVPAKEMIGFRFITIGDPAMRPGQKVVIKHVKGYSDAANPEFRIRQIVHRYSSSAGYVCVGVATQRLEDAALARRIDSGAERSAGSVARDVNDRIRSQAFESPGVEVASVKAAADAYQADLYYGQPAPGNETQPSINVAINQQDDHVYENKPIASPFAWRKCGLVTPVYSGMKAVVAHNRALSSDSIVAGYIWSKLPDFPPPANQSGDWWLCLPIDFDATKPPEDSTKAANDLTANNGCRVIELKGLKITVGADGLKEIGKRPTPGDAEACTIEHASGAVVTVKKGEVDVDTGAGPKLTLSSSGITLTDGTLNVKLANGKLAIG
jgi:hypothetical protein